MYCSFSFTDVEIDFELWANSGTESKVSSVTWSCLTLWDPMNHSKPGFPVHHQLPQFTQIHVH